MAIHNTQIAPSQTGSTGRLPALGTAGISANDVVTVQGITNGTPIPISGSFSLSGATLGAVTTAAPTYTTGTNQALSLTTAGGLRVDGSGSTQPVSIATMPSTPVTGTFWQATQPVSIAATVAISAASLPLPTGAATETTLAAISTKTPALGQALMAASQPVVIASNQSSLPVTVGNASLAVTGTFWQTTQPISGTVTANAGTGTMAVSIASLPALTTGAAVIGALTANQSVNNAQINGIAPLMGNGVTGTGSQRVTIASDNTAFSVVATQVVGANSTTGDTGAKTATGNGATQTNAGNKGVQILLVLGTVSGTTPTLVLKVQGSVDGGTTFYDIPGAVTASLTATGNFGILVYPGVAVTAGTTTTGTTATANMALPRTWRVVWTIGGTTPSFTITNVQLNYLAN